MLTFEVHIVSMEMTSSLFRDLRGLGFSEAIVCGGDPRVTMSILLSAKHFEPEESDKVFAAACQVCDNEPKFCGYIEQETVVHDLRIESSSATSNVDALKYKVTPSPCPNNTYKKCDIHATTNKVDSRVDSVFSSAGYYYIILEKSGIGQVRVNTMQFETTKHALAVWENLVDFAKNCGGFHGTLKLEVTRNFRRFGDYVLPPLVLENCPPNTI